MNSELLHYDTLEEFHKEHFKNLFTQEHIVGEERYIKELVQQGSDSTYEVDNFYVTLVKDNKKYLLRSDMVPKLPIKLTAQTIKYGLKGDVYHYIEETDLISLKVRAEKTMSFKQMVDNLSLLKHSNRDHYKLLWFMELSQMMGRAYFRISTPPGFGKDSTVDVVGSLIGNTHTIESNPTTAQLMKLTYSKHLGVNEVVGTPKAEWNRMQQYLLSVTAFKNKITRRSMNMSGTGGDTLDVSDHSISLMYNDVDCYPKGTTYFDTMASAPIKDRLPSLRLHGVMKEDFNVLEGRDVKRLALDNMTFYVALIRAFHYYKNNLESELHFYKVPSLGQYAERWKTNLGRLIKIIDLYSESQEEFTRLVEVLFASIKDYDDMVRYPTALRDFAKKNRVKVDLFDEDPTLQFLLDHFAGIDNMGHLKKFLLSVRECSTFTEKVLLLDSYVVVKVVKKEVDLSEW